jgi:HlyD family secretion protein
VAQAMAGLTQARAQTDSARGHMQNDVATLRANQDMLNRTVAIAPFDGIVTNEPIREGETVVEGIQNTDGSILMTLADMSVVTAEVKVDETDIISVALGQKADITVDAIPDKIFKGHVIEIGDTAIVRSTGLAASQSAVSSQEAKDFKVVVAMDNPPDDIRPGLSCTAKITTATRKNALTIPIQALTIRQKGDLEPKPKTGAAAVTAVRLTPAEEKARKEEVQGVFVIAGGKAEFRKVETGITGATDIEVLTGLKEGDEIVTGSYQVIRTLRNEAQVKVDNKSPLPQKA